MRVLVTDGESRSALAVTRSLGRRGHEVIVGERFTPALAQVSRYCTHRLVYPDPTHDEQGFIDAIARAVSEHDVDVLLPVTDIATTLVVAHRSSFEPRCRVPFASAEAIARASDKVSLVATAERLGVPVPRSLVLHDSVVPSDMSLPYPVVIKPHRSRVRTPEGWRSCTVSYAATPDALTEDLRRRHAAEFPVLLQERLVGPGLGMFACYHRGALVARFAHRRLREKPPWGGVSVLSESAAVDPVVERYADQLLRGLDWDGVAMVEFKLDERDSVPRLMEINARFWGSLQLAVDAGVDFPGVLVDAAFDRASDVPPPYRLGVRNRWFWGDVDALLLRLFAKGPVGWQRGGRLASTLDFLRLWGPSLYYENPKRDDLSPWLYETWKWIRR